MRKKRILSIVGFFCVLLIVFLIPEAVTYVEDYSLKEKTERYEVEKVNLTPDESYFLTELSDIPDIIINNNITYVDSGEKLMETDIENIAKELIEMLIGRDDIEIWNNRTAVFIAPSVDLRNLYVIWECILSDERENRYYVLIDDNTGKMLAFLASGWKLQYFGEDWQKDLLNRIADYYGFVDEFYLPLFAEEEFICINMYPKDTLEMMDETLNKK